MKPAPKITRNLIFGLCLLTGLMAAVIYAETRQVAVKPTETILEPATVQTQATPTPVAEFKGTSNDYTPAERKAMIEAQTKARKEVEADAKAIANGTYKEPKPNATKTNNQTESDTLPVANYDDCKPGVRTEANVINCGYFYPDEIAKLSYRERAQYRIDDREQYQADAEADMRESLARMMVEDPEQAAAILKSARQAGPTLAKQELFIRLKMASGDSEARAKVLWFLMTRD
jgi:hypothetical protein